MSFDLPDGVARVPVDVGTGCAPTFIEQIARLQAKARRKGGQNEVASSTGTQLPRAPKQLPIWPEPVRAVPNGALRSALFGAICPGRRRFLKGEQLASVDGVKIIFTGERLDQGDLDVWLSVLHAIRLQEIGNQCRVRSYALLKLMGKSDSGKNRDTLHERITRLRAHAVEFKQGRYEYIGGLLDEAFKDKETGEWVIVLSPKLLALFGPDQFTQVQWAVRRELDRQPLAQWLHGFYASHAAPYPMKAKTLLQLAGSENDSPSSARQKLRKALDAVAKASRIHGEGFNYAMVGDLVQVEKTASKAQRRHLVNVAKKLMKPRG